MADSQAKIRTAEQLSVALAGRYVVEREIGAGGMATVYLARDVRHNRKVALKVLKPDLGAALGSERFFSEIQVTANLQHPNLLPLFDSGEAQFAAGELTGGDVRSVLFYVMPYVEGQTLRERLRREGQLPVDEALRLAAGIAGALDYAHRHGVVHRDLKPENILLHEGQPVVMDFGIALAVSNAGGERLTQMGISLGTPQYMSPEQATGDRELDARSDIYSLGAVVYEMLAGSPPHTAGSAQALIAKVIMDRPASVRATRELVPEHVDAALSRALAKLPADRFATAADFSRALTADHAVVIREARAVAAPQASTLSVFVARPAVRRVVAGTAWTTILGAAAAAGAFVALALYKTPELPYARYPVNVPDSVAMPAFGRSTAISPNGSTLAVAATISGQTSRLFVRPMAGVAFAPLHGTDGAASPTFNPDGTQLLFVVNGRLMKVGAEGGSALPLGADSTDGQHSWGDGDQVVFARQGALWSVPAGGGTPRLVAKPDSAHGVRAFRWPDVLPGGTDALVSIERATGVAPDSNHLGVVSLGDGKVVDLGVTGTGARYAAPGYIVYATKGGSLWAAPFSARKRKVTGERVELASGVHVDSTGAADVAVSSAGALVYGEAAGTASRGGTARVALAIVDPKGAIKVTSAQKGDYVGPRVSPDAARIALQVRESPSRSDVWIYEIATGNLDAMTRDALSQFPEWADSRRIVFRENSANPGRYMVQPWDHSGVALPFLSASSAGGTVSRIFGVSLGPTAGYLAFIRDRAVTAAHLHQDIWIARAVRPDSQVPAVSTDASELSPRISPNGKWLAYTSDEQRGKFQLYVQPVPGPGARVPVSIEHGIEPVWQRDGKVLYYVSHDFLLAAHVDERSGFVVTKQDTLFSFAEHGFVVRQPPSRGPSLGFYDVFPNGDFVVLVRGSAVETSRTSVIALMHWQQLLKAGSGKADKK